MPERRASSRPDSSDRRDIPRPPLWLNLALLLLGITALLVSITHRRSIDRRLSSEMQASSVPGEELNQIREQLSSMDLTEAQLANELEDRMKYLDSMKSNEFYLAIDTSRKKLRLQYGNEVIREADIQIGEPRTIEAPPKRWVFPALKGGFAVSGKAYGASWRVPAWVYAANRQPVPAERPTVPGGLGKYVIFLPNDYVIHSQPSPDSPLKGPKPASFLAPEDGLRAIWPRIDKGTKVYVF